MRSSALAEVCALQSVILIITDLCRSEKCFGYHQACTLHCESATDGIMDVDKGEIVCEPTNIVVLTKHEIDLSPVYLK